MTSSDGTADTIRHSAADAVRRNAAKLLSVIRHARDRALHPRRHREVMARLRHGPRPDRIVVLCHGNMFRSPYLAAVLRPLLPDVDVSSAGFVGPSRPVPESGQALARERNVDLSSHRSTLLSREILRTADLVIVMDAFQARHLIVGLRLSAERVVVAGDLDPLAGEGRTIRDPWRRPRAVLESTFVRLDRCAASLANVWPPPDAKRVGERDS